REIHHLRIQTVGETGLDLAKARLVLGIEKLAERLRRELALGAARDLTGARIGEEDMRIRVHYDDAIGRRVEEISVALQRFQAPFRFEPRECDLLRLIAQRLKDAGVT